jgi:hypothetical protein
MEASFRFLPLGTVQMYDLTIEGASHYLTGCGFVNKNCGIDEVTQHTDFRYRYLFSRLRKLVGMDVPIRMRGATNPGGKGHDFVKHRFITTSAPDREFIPAKLIDNPALNAEEYIRSLEHLDPVTRAQLLEGDWDAFTDGRFKRDWLRYYRRETGSAYLRFDDKLYTMNEIRERFLTV